MASTTTVLIFYFDLKFDEIYEIDKPNRKYR